MSRAGHLEDRGVALAVSTRHCCRWKQGAECTRGVVSIDALAQLCSCVRGRVFQSS